MTRARLCLAVALAISVLAGAGTTSVSLASPAADHSHLHHRKHRVEKSISSQKASLEDVSRQLLRTHSRLVDARNSLQSARTELAGVQRQVQAAIARDQRMQARLDAAIARLQAARDDLARGRDQVRTTRSVMASYAVSNYQSGTSFTLGIAFTAKSAQQVLNSLQASTTVLDKQSMELQRLQASRVLLKLTAERVQESKVEVQHRRVLAAQNLQQERQLQAQAQLAKQAVASRVSTLRGARDKMAAAKQQERHRLQVLRGEQSRINQQLHRLAERRARQARQSSGPVSAKTSARPGSGYLTNPLHTNTYVTSPYGMRMHPILHIWELHDGTDFYAPCGTPVYAAANGRVMSEYFNAGYGNVLLLDNGMVRGVSLSTSYNHLSRYVASVGARVHRGQLIAYSGDTGWSTGCHLHFSVYVNGSTVDPMTWL